MAGIAQKPAAAAKATVNSVLAGLVGESGFRKKMKDSYKEPTILAAAAPTAVQDEEDGTMAGLKRKRSGTVASETDGSMAGIKTRRAGLG